MTYFVEFNETQNRFFHRYPNFVISNNLCKLYYFSAGNPFSIFVWRIKRENKLKIHLDYYVEIKHLEFTQARGHTSINLIIFILYLFSCNKKDRMGWGSRTCCPFELWRHGMRCLIAQQWDAGSFVVLKIFGNERLFWLKKVCLKLMNVILDCL